MKSLGLFSLLIINLFAQEAIAQKNTQDAILWRISGNGLKQPSYLFGTIHLYCDAEKINNSTIQKCIDSSEVIALELNLNDFGTLIDIFKLAMKSSNKTLSEQLNQAQYRIVDQACRMWLNDSLVNLDNKTPMTLLSNFYTSKLMLDCRAAPVDFLIADMAKQAKKQTIGLETVEFQESILSSIPDSLQLQWLIAFCLNPEQSQKDLKTLISTYDEQSSDKLYDLIFKTSPELTFLKEEMLDARNEKWVAFLNNEIKTKSHFIAVGAGHLAGPKGMLQLFRSLGYTLTAVRY
ncbi:MAG: TraB/GumN family protein [Bacteroidota bacterium]|nr:TraB/GumN family protein [Bacteroidota bacterium]